MTKIKTLGLFLVILVCLSFEICNAQTIDDYVAGAYKSIQEENYNNALNYSNSILALDPKNAKGFLARGISYTGLAQYIEAEADILQAIKYDSNEDNVLTGTAYFFLGEVQIELNKNDEALKNLNTAIKLDPKNADYRNQRGLLQSKLKKYPLAVDDLTKAIELSNNASIYYNNRGYIKFEMGDINGALIDLNKALEIDPNSGIAYDSRADIKRKNNDYKGALVDYSKALALDSKNENYYLHRGRLLMEIGEYDDALTDIQSATYYRKDFYEAFLLKAEVYIMNGSYEEANSNIRSCINAIGGNKDAQILLDKMYSVSYFLNNYVESRLRVWQLKGEFEKSTEYFERISEAKRKTKINKLAEEGFNELKLRAGKRIQENSFEISIYDADNESYKLNHKELGDIIIKVPANIAPTFKDNYKSYIWSRPDFMVKDDRLVLSYMEFTDNFSKYIYDITKLNGYNPKEYNFNFAATKIDLSSKTIPDVKSEEKLVVKDYSQISEVDQNIPISTVKNSNAFGIIFGIENYKNVKSPVTYAENDAKIVKEYFVKTLGIPEEQIYFRTNDNVTSAEFRKVFEGWLQKRVDTLSEVYVYYAGHGAPSKDASAYLIPYDGDPDYAEQTGYSLDKLYEKLGQLKAKRSIIFLDACFSGQSREQKMLLADARSIGIKPKDASSNEKLTIFSASSSDQVSSGWPEKNHGLFTYYLLKGLQGDADENKDSKISVSELGKFVSTKVSKQAGFLNREQSPQIKSSEPTFELRK